MKPPFEDVIADLRLMERLSSLDPILIGTPPLGIDIGSSDIDLACSAEDLSIFARLAETAFGHRERFALREVSHLPEAAIVAQFFHWGWEIEIFCQTRRTAEQWGVRHFRIERRLLELEPALRPEVIALKRDGLKTEPAFAKLLGLTGDPYQAMLDLEPMSDDELRHFIQRSLVRRHR